MRAIAIIKMMQDESNKGRPDVGWNASFVHLGSKELADHNMAYVLTGSEADIAKIAAHKNTLSLQVVGKENGSVKWDDADIVLKSATAARALIAASNIPAEEEGEFVTLKAKASFRNVLTAFSKVAASTIGMSNVRDDFDVDEVGIGELVT